MAETKSMTAEEVVRYLLEEGDGLDFLRESLTWVVQQLMEVEVSALIGAKRGERSDERLTHRNGYRLRPWQTRAGELELAIPKLRQGSYFPTFLEPRKRLRRCWRGTEGCFQDPGHLRRRTRAFSRPGPRANGSPKMATAAMIRRTNSKTAIPARRVLANRRGRLP